MSQNLTNANAALKDDYQPSVVEQLNNEIMMLAQIEQNSKDVEGRNAVLSLHISRNNGTGARPENGTLPGAGHQGYVEERVGMKHNYGRIELSGPVIRAMKSDRGSFVRAIESEVTGIVTDLKRDVNRQVYNNANGTIAQAGVTTASATVVLTDSTDTQHRQLEVGSLIDIGTLADPDAVVAGAVVVSVDRSAGTVTIDSSVTTSASHYISRAGSRPNASGSTYELTGLQAIVNDSGTLHNIDPGVVASWKSTVSGNGGTDRAATDNLFEVVIDEVSLESGKTPDFIVTTHGVRRNYASQLKAQKRFNDTTELKGGFSALSVDAGNVSLPLVAERDCPGGTAFVLTKGEICQHQMSDWEFMDEDGAVLNRVSGKDAYEATLFKYHELTTKQRNVHARIDDLTES